MKYLLPLLFLLLFACSPKHYAAKNFTEVSVGHGGGFTGAVTEYTISATGMVHKIEGLEPGLQQVGVLPHKTFRRVDRQFKRLNLTDYNYSNPGNYSHFIKLRKGSQLHIVTWADGKEQEVRQDVIELYTWLTSQINQIEQKQ